MEIRVKNKYKATIKSNHKKYLEKILCIDTPNFTKRFERLKRNCNNLLRRKEGSIKSIKESSRIVKIIFGISEDIIRLSLPQYDFEIEKEIINLYIIEGLKIRRNTKYFGECRFYGEVLLNLYLDVLIVLTSNDIARIIEHKPMYLVNPETGKNLELDITLEGVKLSFELQGDTHYLNENELKKDKFKIIKSIV